MLGLNNIRNLSSTGGRDENFADVGIKELQKSGRYSSGIMDVFGKLYDDLGFGELFKGQHATRYNHILKACVVARLANPSRKLKTTRQLEKKFNVRLHVDSIYRMMDNLVSERVKSAVCKATLNLLLTVACFAKKISRCL